MFDVFYSGIKPNLFAHEREAQSIEHAQSLCRSRYFWWVSYLSDYREFDFDYEPAPWQSKFTHVWPSQHHEYSGTYLVPRSGEINYHFHKRIVPNQEHANEFATLVAGVEFDYTWAPHPHDPPYIYVFGNQWWPAEKMPTVEYHVPGATERKYMSLPAATLPSNPNRPWYDVVESDMDYSWVPDPGDPPYIYVFGNQWWPAAKMPTVEYRMPGATERKYVTWPRAELLPDRARWTVPESVDAAQLDYSWVPDPGDPPYRYQFATQHQKTGGPVYTVPGATETKYLAELKIRTAGKATAIYEIDHLDGNAGQIPNTTKTVRYFDNYRDTLVRLARSIGTEHEYVWVCSSICDYTGFDFTWHPEDWQATMLHVFASNGEQFGDTFFMHVPTFAENGDRKALLEWYDVNFVNAPVPRRPMPVIEHTSDTHVEAVKRTDWAGPLALFTTNGVPMTLPTVPLWRTETKNIVPLSAGASAVIVPRTAKSDIRTQMYDYPYIDRSQRRRHSDERLDIVFISNGEPIAEHNFNWMTRQCKLANRVKHIKGITGRVAAYHAAAQASQTPWFFAVFAKLEVNANFDFGWQPDRMQQPKHYIFHAKNPVNGLEYGHQAMIAYNRELVLNNPGVGLDFTLDSAHEVVPTNSGIAYYDYTPWMAWRTAFREAIKLRASLPDVENEYRLKEWLGRPLTPSTNGQWSQWGAQDAVEYYEQVKGNPTELRKSYEWDWLASYAFVKRSLVPDQ